MKKLYILDVSALVYRCWHAMTPLTTTNGLVIHAFYGTCSMLSKMIQNLAPEYMIAACDHIGKCFRHNIYSDYKKDRTERPEELDIQFRYVYQLLDALSVSWMEKEGYEADDIIAGLVGKYKDVYECIIFSGDKDLSQLVGGNVKQMDFDYNIRDWHGIFDKFGVYPSQMVDYLSMVGDASDSIPGVQGIGKKTAVELLNKYSTVDNIYKNLDEIYKPKSKKKEYFIRDRERCELAKRLIRLELDLDVEDVCVRKLDPSIEALDSLFRKVDFVEPDERFPGLYNRRTISHENNSVIMF